MKTKVLALGHYQVNHQLVAEFSIFPIQLNELIPFGEKMPILFEMLSALYLKLLIETEEALQKVFVHLSKCEQGLLAVCLRSVPSGTLSPLRSDCQIL